MDEKTEELRDIFMDVSDEETVTERQSETRGSFAERDDERERERLTEVIEGMRERVSFDTDLATDAYVALVRGFYDGDDDAALADRIDADAATARRARLDLHLVRDADTDLDVSLDAVADADNADPETVAANLDADVDAETVRRAQEVVAARREARRTNYRFRDRFEEILTDADLSARLAEGAREDGLEEAAEDIETDVSF